MEETAQRIWRLAHNLRPDEPLGKNGVLQAAFLRLQQLGIIQIKVNRPLAKLRSAIKIADTSDQSKAESKMLSAIANNGPGRKFCVKRDKHQSRGREQIKGLPGLGRAQINQAYRPEFREGGRYAREA